MSKQQNTTDSAFRKRIVLITVSLIILVICSLSAFIYWQLYHENIQEGKITYITISDQDDLISISDKLYQQRIISNRFSFYCTAKYYMSFNPKPGKYELDKSLKTNVDLIRKLRGRQMTIQLTFHNLRKIDQLAGLLGKHLQYDSIAFINLFKDSVYLEKIGHTKEDLMTVFIPNTYEFYWNCTPEDFMERMLKENKKFWNEDRLSKLDAIQLTKKKAYILASIVECESQYKPERKTIAGVYMNRIRKNWRLEADPTVIFAIGDFSIKRVLQRHLENPSPYNTYLHEGLPPGPIYMSSINAIDAVLENEKHNYMFFCAKPPEAGEKQMKHAFAKTHRAHINNAKKYWRWIRKNT